MKGWQKAISLTVLGLAEVVFLSWILAPNLPHRAADASAFMRYQSEPTEENKELWLKERRVTQREVTLRRALGFFLTTGDLVLIVWVVRKRTSSPIVAEVLSSQTPLDVK
jgi:hypothetical protein